MAYIQDLLEIVRGESHWRAAQIAGVTLQRKPTEFVWSFPSSSEPPILVHLKDVVEGIKRLYRDPEALREWASFLLAANSLVSFHEFEDTPEGDKLLEVLWDISFGADPGLRLRDVLDLQ